MPRRLLLVSQVYVPDPAAVGQYMAEAAGAMAKRGWEVTVLTADRGYDDPEQRFPSREVSNGVAVRRLRFSSLGKKTILHRLIGQFFFCLQATLRGLLMGRPDAVLITTSPPMGSIVGLVISWIRRVPVKYWVMDINPDQAVILGKARAGSLPVKAFDWLNRRILARASDIIVLDSFMAETMARKHPAARPKLRIIPPWPLENHLERIPHQENPFRREHGLEGKFVLMYSGNHSLVHPLTTVLEAAPRVGDLKGIAFVFIGGGVGKKEVDELIERDRPPHVLSLPYQPLDRIKYSLSAADIHLVVMGDEMAGIVHVCKFYAAMALGKPVLFVGPERSHIGELLSRFDFGWRLDHGHARELEDRIRGLAGASRGEIETKGERGRQAIRDHLSMAILTEQLCRVIEG